jgi:flagellar biosynthetic protein FliQ
MSATQTIDLIRGALYTTLWLCLPLLAIGFVASILISLVQTITAIQDSAFSALPRLAVFLAALVLTLPWMLQKWMAYAIALFEDLGRYAR